MIKPTHELLFLSVLANVQDTNNENTSQRQLLLDG